MQVDSSPAAPQGKPKNIGVGNLSLLRGIFPTQESNQGFPHCGRILYQLSYQGSPKVKVKVTQLGLLATPGTIQSMEFSRPCLLVDNKVEMLFSHGTYSWDLTPGKGMESCPHHLATARSLPSPQGDAHPSVLPAAFLPWGYSSALFSTVFFLQPPCFPK